MVRARSVRWAALCACACVAGCTIRTAESGGVAGDALVADPPPTTLPAGPAGPAGTARAPGTTSDATTTTATSPRPRPEPAPTTAAPLTGWDATDAYLERRIIGGGSSAASFAVSVDGEIVHTVALGTRVLGSADPVEPHDRFRIASISKTITAITMLQLVEQGVVGLDDPVGDVIAAALGVQAQPGGTADITVRQLLTHTSGFAQSENLFFRNQVGSCREAATVGLRDSLQGTPGSGYRYSNMNYCVLGLLIEQLAAKPYEDVVYEQLLTPLGLSGMRLAPTDDPGPDEVQHRTVPGRNYMEVLGAAGAWIATPTDLVTIIDALDLTEPGWKPLDETTLAAMKTSVSDPLVPDRGYGMGLILYGGGAFGHTGTIESTHSMVVDRGDGVSWAVTVSGEYPSNTSDIAKIVDNALVAGGFIAGAPLVVE